MERLRRKYGVAVTLVAVAMAIVGVYAMSNTPQAGKTRLLRRPVSQHAVAVIEAENDAALLLPDEDPEAFENEANDPDAGVPEGEWFWRQRAYPLTTVPFDASGEAWRRASRMSRARQNAWQALGPAPILESPIGVNYEVIPGGLIRNTAAGRVRAIAIDGKNSNIMYVAFTSGGVWKSTDGGQSFVSLTDNRPEFAFAALALDPQDSNTIYAGTGELSDYYGTGLLKSTNGGQSWTRLGEADFGANAITSIVVNPTNPNTVYVATSWVLRSNLAAGKAVYRGGIFRSTDGGASWTKVLAEEQGYGFSDLVIDDSNPQVLYAANGGVDIYKTTDGGEQFQKLNVNFGREAFRRIELAIGSGPNGAKTLYAGIDGKKQVNGVLKPWGYLFKTTNGGATWQSLDNTPNYCSTQCWYDNAIIVDPRDANVAYIGGSLLVRGNVWHGMVHKTVDGGASWTDITPATAVDQAIHADVHTFAFDPQNPDILWTGNDGGLYRYTNDKWETRNATFGTLKFIGVAVHPTKNEAFGGMQDNAHAYYDGSKWSGLLTGDGNKAEYDPFNPNLIYSGMQSSPSVNFAVISGTNLAELRQFFYRGLTQGIGNERVEFYVPFEVDPHTRNALYLGTTKIYRTVNNGIKWNAISENLVDEKTTIRSIGVSPSDPNTVYAGTTKGHIIVGKNQGGQWSWTNKTNAETLPNRYLNDIAVGLTDSNVVYLAYNGFSENSKVKGHVFKSTDGGNGWTRLDNNGFPDTPALSILLNPDQPGQIFVGTDVGVFVSNDDGQNWATLNDGLPVVPVTDLKYRKLDSTLWAATYGRSVFKVALKSTTPTATPLPTNTPTLTPTNTATPLPTNTATLTPTNTATPLPTNTATLTPTNTATPLPTNTNTPIPTNTPTPVPNTPVPGSTATPTPTNTNTPLPTDTVTPTPTNTNTPLPTNTVTPTPTNTNTPLPTNTVTPTPTNTPTPLPTDTPSVPNTTTPTQTPIPTNTPTPANTPTLAPVGVVGGSWSGDKAIFDVTTGTDQNIFNLRIRVSQAGCDQWFSQLALVKIATDGSFTASGAERDYKWSISGKFNGYTAQGQATFQNLSMGTSVCGTSFTGTIDWTATWQAPVANPTATPIPTATPTVVPVNTNGIYGRVTANGVGVAGLTVMLGSCNADDDCPAPTLDTALKATTDENGFYNIPNAPATHRVNAAAATSYYVYYFNDEEGGNTANDLYVYTWSSAPIKNYTAGSSLKVEDMDISELFLLEPEEVAQPPFPITFTWTARANTTANYVWVMFDWDSGDSVCESQPAPQTAFTLTESFYNQNCAPSVTATGEYGWYALVIMGQDFDNNTGYGDSYYAGDVKLPAGTGKSFLPIINRNK